MTFKRSIMLGVTVPLLASMALADVKVGFIGSLSSNTGLSTLRGAGIAIEGISTTGGMNGEKLVLVSAGTNEDVTEGVKAYKYLAEIEEVDFIISGSVDDVGLGQLPRMQEFQIPTLDIWTSYIGVISMVIESPETMAPYFMNIASDEALATLYVNFGADVLKEETGQDSTVILAKDIAFGEAIVGLVTEALGPVAGIEAKEIITYDVDTVGFTSLFSKAQASGADFIYQVSSMNSQVISSQYMRLQVSMAMTSVSVSALGLEYWEDTDGAGDGISTLSLIPSAGLKLGPESQKLVDTYQVKYDSRPKMPHFDRFSAYWGPEQAIAAAKATDGFGGAKAWSAEMEKQDITLKKDGKMWLRYVFWGDDEIEEVTGQTHPRNVRFNLTAPYDDVQPSIVVTQWEGDGEVGMVYLPEYTTTKFTVPSRVE